ncbi:WhiB family transcriptional regulator [Streptomyces europaeiscabiei]|uniref:WhiB family transcriptional regulator n=1 Tax=Streptomyces europaeiscabiei TaxID=146819 RepID=UPI0029AA2A2D|nr:WhiB family transcriptional regulator [Streptomyces europaeiscabiei]MDX3587558.1 WhiB family transcriptional regulator [Streptomyces europaeiscabiei]
MKRVSVAIVRNHAYAPVSTDAPVRPRAACADEDSELFFPIGNTGPALLQIEEAKAVCRRGCPLMESCLQGALERNELGVWGGTDEDDRRRMKRRAARRRAAA